MGSSFMLVYRAPVDKHKTQYFARRRREKMGFSEGITNGDFTIENRMHFGPQQAENFGVFRVYSVDFTKFIENRMYFGPPQAGNFGGFRGYSDDFTIENRIRRRRKITPDPQPPPPPPAQNSLHN